MNAPHEIGRQGRKVAQVLEGARAVFMRDGFEGASVDEIAREAGVSKATLYSYFPDKRLLFMEVAKSECGRQAEAACDRIATRRSPGRGALRRRLPNDALLHLGLRTAGLPHVRRRKRPLPRTRTRVLRLGPDDGARDARDLPHRSRRARATSSSTTSNSPPPSSRNSARRGSTCRWCSASRPNSPTRRSTASSAARSMSSWRATARRADPSAHEVLRQPELPAILPVPERRRCADPRHAGIEDVPPVPRRIHPQSHRMTREAGVGVRRQALARPTWRSCTTRCPRCGSAAHLSGSDAPSRCSRRPSAPRRSRHGCVP